VEGKYIIKTQAKREKTDKDSVDFRGALWYLFVLTKAQGGGNMSDIISDLYYGELRLSEREYRKNAQAENLLETFGRNEAWLTDHLEGAAKERLLELVNCHDELDGLAAYESFRAGFLLGARLIMEISQEGGI